MIDSELGRVAVTVNVRSRRFVFRYRDGMLCCTSPWPYRESDVRRAIDELRPKLRELIRKGEQKALSRRFTPETRINADDFHLRFEQKSVSFVRMEQEADSIVCYYERPEILESDDVQAWITKTLQGFARKLVRERLFPRLATMARQRSITVTDVRVSSAKGRWGSCSAKGSINLSLYLILLPRHLQDYVLQHELTHRIEMNHSPRFWSLLDEACGGSSLSLRKEMRSYDTSFV